MNTQKKKGLILIITSVIVLPPNLAGLLVAIFVLHPAPYILYIVPSVMIVLAIIGLILGVYFRKKKQVL